MPDRPISLDTIINEIRQLSNREVDAIQKSLEREKELIVRRANKEAEQIRSELVKRAKTQADFIHKQVAAIASLEVKRLELQAKTIIIAEIMKQVKERLLALRRTPEYLQLLKLMIFEGVRSLNVEKVLISGGDREQALLTPDFLKSLETAIRQKVGHNIQLRLNRDFSSDPGVIIYSNDKRLRFDNRIALRIERIFEAHRWSIMQEFMDNHQQE